MEIPMSFRSRLDRRQTRARPDLNSPSDAGRSARAIPAAHSARGKAPRPSGRAQTPSSPLGIHDERSDAIGRLGGRRVIGHVDAGPPLTVPFDDRLFRIPGLAVEVGARAIVENSPVGRPSPGPVRSDALLARI